jgi:hydroxyethylthiazole kinase-like uncharacterized protein yjeF
MKILTVQQMQKIEKETHDAGFSYSQMMENAGKGVAEVIKKRVSSPDHHILVLVGPGNNGGDGLVAARVLHLEGYRIIAYLSRTRDPESDTVFKKALDFGVPILYGEQDQECTALINSVHEATVIIDALLGTGSSPPLHGSIAEVLRCVRQVLHKKTAPHIINLNEIPAIHDNRPLIIAVDGPSGLNFDTGEVDNFSLPADITVTFAAPKWGQFKRPGANLIGELVVVDIGAHDIADVASPFTVATADQIKTWLPKRPQDAHKGTFGRAMIVAGSANYTGAAILSAKAALRAGAGLVTLAIPNSLHSAVVAAIPEATYLLLPHTMGVVNEQALGILKENWQGYQAMLIGPGLGNTSESQAFLNELFLPSIKKRRTGFVTSGTTQDTEIEKLPPLIMDADGLNILSTMPDWHTYLPPRTILTPHPGEMSRLTGLSTSEINKNKFDLALHWAKTWGHIVLLKGANTVIANPEGSAIVLPFSNPGLSTAGTGDVLAGTVAALLAQGMPPYHAAVTGAYLHGLAGEICRRKLGAAGMIAGDVTDAIAEALHLLES